MPMQTAFFWLWGDPHYGAMVNGNASGEDRLSLIHWMRHARKAKHGAKVWGWESICIKALVRFVVEQFLPFWHLSLWLLSIGMSTFLKRVMVLWRSRAWSRLTAARICDTCSTSPQSMQRKISILLTGYHVSGTGNDTSYGFPGDSSSELWWPKS